MSRLFDTETEWPLLLHPSRRSSRHFHCENKPSRMRKNCNFALFSLWGLFPFTKAEKSKLVSELVLQQLLLRASEGRCSSAPGVPGVGRFEGKQTIRTKNKRTPDQELKVQSGCKILNLPANTFTNRSAGCATQLASASISSPYQLGHNFSVDE